MALGESLDPWGSYIALITEEGFLISPCYPLELQIQIGISLIFSRRENENTFKVEDINIQLTPMDRSSRHKINKEMQALMIYCATFT